MNKNPHQVRRHHNMNRSATKHGGNGKIALQPGSVIFRMLCHVDTAGGVIGSSGAVIKQLETQTGCKIRFEEPLPNCHERVINVIGDVAIDKKITLKVNVDLGGWPQWGDDHGGEYLEVEVSAAQSGLMRVFERILEVKRNENGVIGCRLLAGMGQVGGVMGTGGKIIIEIQKNSGAKIRIMKKDQTPSCAAPEEELIQITGDVMAVKKALVAVSHCLQVCPPQERKRSHFSPLQDSPANFLEKSNPMLQSASGNHSSSVCNSLSEDVENILTLDKENSQRKVVYRLLCSNGSAGGVIGKGASVVKEMEKETGAAIKFSSPAAGLKERVATISSLESQYSSHSSAQNAAVLVFARSVEVDFDKGYITDLSESGTVNARILVTANEINCLIDDRGIIASDISVATSVEIQLLGANSSPNFSAGDDKVIQIIGAYERVKNALFQVTGRLRDNLFSISPPGQEGPTQHSYSAIPTTSPYGNCTTPEVVHSSELPLGDQTSGPGFVRNGSRGSCKFRSPHEQMYSCSTPEVDHSSELPLVNQTSGPGIIGAYERVKNALFQVTGRLRDNLFSISPPGQEGPTQHSYSAIPTTSPYGNCTTPEVDHSSELPLVDQTSGPGFVRNGSRGSCKFRSPHEQVYSCSTPEVDHSSELPLVNQTSGPGVRNRGRGSYKFRLPHEQFNNMGRTKNLKNSAKKLSGGAVGQKSVDAEAMIIQTIEVCVSEKAFGYVYGENESNLTRIKEISGAKVTVEDPCPGISDGKVIISGTPEQILVAQSLLQAFIRN